jgi:hypothetical protein
MTDPLAAALAYREELQTSRLDDLVAGNSISSDGRIFVWLDIYISWLRGT